MIKNFSVFYVGSIDLDDVGLDGIPANDRNVGKKWMKRYRSGIRFEFNPPK